MFRYVVIFILWRKTKSGRTHILLAGLSDAGKTALFSRLLFGEDKETFSSITANAADYIEASEQVRVIMHVCVYMHVAVFIVYSSDGMCVRVCVRRCISGASVREI